MTSVCKDEIEVRDGVTFEVGGVARMDDRFGNLLDAESTSGGGGSFSYDAYRWAEGLVVTDSSGIPTICRDYYLVSCWTEVCVFSCGCCVMAFVFSIWLSLFGTSSMGEIRLAATGCIPNLCCGLGSLCEWDTCVTSSVGTVNVCCPTHTED